jgi:hypothetical protein
MILIKVIHLIQSCDTIKAIVEISLPNSFYETSNVLELKDYLLFITPIVTLMIALISFYFNKKQIEVSQNSIKNAKEIAKLQIDAEIVKKRNAQILDTFLNLASDFLSIMHESEPNLHKLSYTSYQLIILLSDKSEKSDNTQGFLNLMSEIVSGLKNEELSKMENKKNELGSNLLKFAIQIKLEIQSKLLNEG